MNPADKCAVAEKVLKRILFLLEFTGFKLKVIFMRDFNEAKKALK